MKRMMRRSVAVSVIVCAVVAPVACGGGPSDTIAGTAPAGTTVLRLYAYSVSKPGYDTVIGAFRRTAAGSTVTVEASYGASGDQSRKVAQGAQADVVSLSTGPDITRLVDTGLVAHNWNSGPDGGAPFGSVVVLVVRKGNPKNIHDWNDLLRPGISVVTPNPFSSGSAKWNLLAPYAAASDGGRNASAGLAYLAALLHHVHVQPASGREATEAFANGTGDVLISYENEAIATAGHGAPVERIIPPETMKIENPVAVVTDTTHPRQARAFRDFLSTDAGQRAWARAGFRPTSPVVAAEFAGMFPPPARMLWTIADLGGWQRVDPDLFAPDTGKVAVLYAAATR